jgi:hypothetical protein
LDAIEYVCAENDKDKEHSTSGKIRTARLHYPSTAMRLFVFALPNIDVISLEGHRRHLNSTCKA